jgi:hypothetical protein
MREVSMEPASIGSEAVALLEAIELRQHLCSPEGGVPPVKSIPDEWLPDTGRKAVSGQAHPEVPVRKMRQACVEPADPREKIRSDDHIGGTCRHRIVVKKCGPHRLRR